MKKTKGGVYLFAHNNGNPLPLAEFNTDESACEWAGVRSARGYVGPYRRGKIPVLSSKKGPVHLVRAASPDEALGLISHRAMAAEVAHRMTFEGANDLSSSHLTELLKLLPVRDGISKQHTRDGVPLKIFNESI